MTKQNSDKKTLVLTGASRGIGHATVKRFSEEGWRVITCSRHAFPENCPWPAGEEDHLQINLSDQNSIIAGIAELLERLDGQPLHALVNNAAISPKTPSGGRMDSKETPIEDWHEVFQVNFFAPIMLARGLADALIRGQGAIVNVTSIAGSKVHNFAGTAYATSKAALSSLTREMANDFGSMGVRVNAIAPGEIKTDMISDETETVILPDIPMNRLGTTKEVADSIYFLCSNEASYVNGAELHINGGQHV
ncbi:MAG: SDR family NAD(P)-dependent oxidoreductase [Candidatus Puniceispirillales bacterium]